MIRICRRVVENHLKDGNIDVGNAELSKKCGVFVSIHSHPDHELRGCIGYPRPVFSLGEAIQRSAISAAFQDPRFRSLRESDLDRVIFEVSILTEPELIKTNNPQEILEKIEVGKDGLILERGLNSGLLLPQVWEKIPQKEKFMEMLCLKAGLTPDSWMDENVKVYKFKVEAFKEVEPLGKVIQT